jgi:hypothetical protein
MVATSSQPHHFLTSQPQERVFMSTISEQMLSLYGRGFEQFGDDPRAFFHNDHDSQYERFHLLAQMFQHETRPFTVHEIGCSTGHFGEFLREFHPLATYSGSDIYAPFADVCRQKYGRDEFFVRDVSREVPADRYDYVVTCLFNLPGTTPRDEWQQFIRSMLTSMYAMAERGVGTTFLTTYYDPGRNSPDLHYQDEKELLDFAVRALSRHVALVASGPLYEYALHVYQPSYVRSRHPQPSLSKYFKLPQ